MNNTQMLKGILDWCVLSIIKRKKVFSQEIISQLRDYNFGDISDGTLFPLMLRLEKDGLVESEKKDNPLGASRKYYSINTKGEKELKEFVVEWKLFRNAVNNILEAE